MIDEYTGKKLISPLDFPKPVIWIHDETKYEEALKHLRGLTHCSTEIFADLLDIIFGEKFTIQHAILLSAVLRRMDCCELAPFDVACLQ
ncbi:hypothetical protein EG832_04285 [bacterium]|nr:hypothetical protein [bacterium]